jgi:hypothetical protein
VGHLTGAAHEAQKSCFTTQSDEEPLITLELAAKGGVTLRALLDSGASNNFVRKRTLVESGVRFSERVISPTLLTVRLATGAIVKLRKRVVALHYALQGKQYDDNFIVLDLDDKFDAILGMPWLKKHEPQVNWTTKSLSLKSPSSRAHLMACDSRAPNGAHDPTGGDGPIGSVSASDTAITTAPLNAVRDPSPSHRVRAKKSVRFREPVVEVPHHSNRLSDAMPSACIGLQDEVQSVRIGPQTVETSVSSKPLEVAST